MSTLSKNPLISVVIPYYNPPLNYFRKAVESILSQSYSNWEAIIVNDESTPENKDFLRNYMDNLNEKRISLTHHERNFGPSVARNKGIELSKGDMITFLDSDDLFLPWYFKEVIEKFNANPDCQIISSPHFYLIDDLKIKKIVTTKTVLDIISGRENTERVLDRMKQARQILFPHLFINKYAFKHLTFDSSLIIGEDIDLILQIMDNPALLESVSLISTPGYIYRQYPSKTRVGNNLVGVLKSYEILKNKYNDKNKLSFKLVSTLSKTRDDWKFSKPLINYIQNESLISYLRDICSNFTSIKDKIKSIKVLLIANFIHKFSLPRYGIDYKYITVLTAKQNSYKQIKKQFTEFIIRQNNKDSYYFAKKMFKSIFSNKKEKLQDICINNIDTTHNINKEKTEKYFEHFNSVYGYFNILSAKSLLWLNSIQKKEKIEGNIFEIGVLLGKSAILLGLFVNQEKERLGLCDYFMAGKKLGVPQKEVLYKNLNSYFEDLSFIDIYEKDSSKLTKDECKNCRFFHIDGGHTLKHLTNDLNLAGNSIVEKGLILIDDFFNPRCPEVTEGVYQYLKDKKNTLLPLLIAFGKLILCTRSMYTWYLEKLNIYDWKNYINDVKVDLLKTRMFNHEILVFTKSV